MSIWTLLMVVLVQLVTFAVTTPKSDAHFIGRIAAFLLIDVVLLIIYYKTTYKNRKIK